MVVLLTVNWNQYLLLIYLFIYCKKIFEPEVYKNIFHVLTVLIMASSHIKECFVYELISFN